MNIFYLHHNPYKAATFFYDKHKVKMILECAQMLCTAHHVHDNGDNVPYKKAHLNHPSTYGLDLVGLTTIGCMSIC